MRITRLKLERFGHFQDAVIDIPQTDALCVIFGRNEAGKSTLLESVRALLFGFPHQTPYDFRFDTSTLAVEANLAFQDGVTAQVRRTKGRKDTLKGTSAAGGEVDSAWLEARLDRATAGLFNTVFGFSLSDLAQGAEALETGQARDAIFGGGTGGRVAPDRVLSRLDEEIGELYKERGSSKTINKALRELDEIRKSLKEATLPGAEWRQLDESTSALKEKLEAIKRRCAELQHEKTSLERDLRAVEHWRALDQIEKDLEGVRVPPGLPADAETQYTKLLAEWRAKSDAAADLERNLAKAKKALDEISPDAKILEAGDAIERIQQEIAIVEAARRDLPELLSNQLSREARIEAGLKPLRPGWTLTSLESPSLDELGRETWKRRLQAWRAAADGLKASRAEHKRLQESLLDAENGLRELGATEGLEALRSLQAQVESYERDRRPEESELRRRIHKARAGSTAIAARLGRLGSLTGKGATGAERWPVPRPAEIAPIADAWRALEEEAKKLELRQSELERQRTQLEKERVATGSHVPSAADLQAARARRERGWRLVRKAWLEGMDIEHDAQEYDAGAKLPEAYEQAVMRADAVADTLREHADEVATRAAEDLRARQLDVDVTALASEKNRHRKSQDELVARWRALWAPSGLEPSTPLVMQDWLKEHADLVGVVIGLQADEEHFEELTLSDHKLTETLRTALGAPTATLESSIADLKRRLADEQKRETLRQQLTTDIAVARKAVGRAQEKADGLAKDAGEAEAKVMASLRALGIDEALSIDDAESVLSGLATLRLEARQATELRERIAQIRGTLDEFDRRTSRLTAELAPELGDLDTINATRELVARLKRARESARDKQQSEERSREIAAAHEKAVSGRDASWRALQALREQAGALDDAAFYTIAQQASHALKLEEKHRDELKLAGKERGGESIEAFRSRLASADPLLIAERASALKDEIAAAEIDRDSLSEKHAQAAYELAKHDGTSRAAALQADREARRAELRGHVERYAVLALARACLEKELKRFEAENQPEILRQAGGLFSEMTEGRHARIYRRLDEAGTLVAVEAATGVERVPAALSTGAREQLYLALRLAYVAQYSRKAEPLPVVLDDVLVNFDAPRARATLRALARGAIGAQTILFTCHEHIVALAQEVLPGLNPVLVPAVSGEGAGR